jgi:hypothetical protein
MAFDHLPIVARGTWLYDGSVPIEVRIVRSEIAYGSGDQEDPPEIAEDRHVACYYLLYESTIEPGRFPAGGGGYFTVAEAMAAAARNAPGVEWHSPPSAAHQDSPT